MGQSISKDRQTQEIIHLTKVEKLHMLMNGIIPWQIKLIKTSQAIEAIGKITI